jgi:hypothetical protein
MPVKAALPRGFAASPFPPRGEKIRFALNNPDFLYGPFCRVPSQSNSLLIRELTGKFFNF